MEINDAVNMLVVWLEKHLFHLYLPKKKKVLQMHLKWVTQESKESSEFEKEQPIFP